MNKELQKMTREVCKKMKLDSDERKIASIMLAPLVLGSTKLADICKATCLPEGFVSPAHKNLIRSGIFNRGKVCCGWFDKDGGISFVADICVAKGYLERVAVSRGKNERSRAGRKTVRRG